MQSRNDFKACADRLAMLAEPTRLRIVVRLLDGPKNVSDICEELGEVIVKVSHHLKMLKRANIVEGIKYGRIVIYRLAPDVVEMVEPSKGSPQQLDLGCCQLAFAAPSRKAH